MIEKKAFNNVSYGLYIVASKFDGRDVGCVINTFAQVTSDPPQVSISINNDNFTTQGIRQTGKFTVTVLSEDADMSLISTFGFRSSKDIDKFEDVRIEGSTFAVPYVLDGACALFAVEVTSEVNLGTHTVFFGSVIEAKTIEGAAPMTYAFYHQMKGGRTPEKAASFSTDELEAEARDDAKASQSQLSADVSDDELAADQGTVVSSGTNPSSGSRIGWRCMLCGHIEYVDELPDDFVCPVCGATKDLFERIEL